MDPFISGISANIDVRSTNISFFKFLNSSSDTYSLNLLLNLSNCSMNGSSIGLNFDGKS